MYAWKMTDRTIRFISANAQIVFDTFLRKERDSFSSLLPQLRYMKSSINQINPLIEDVKACEQEFWFGISRFMREIPNLAVCLAGPQHDVNVTLTSFDTRGNHHIRKTKECFCSVLFELSAGLDDQPGNHWTSFIQHA